MEMDVAGNNDGGKAQMAVTEEAKTPENAQGSEAVLAEDAKIVAENGAIEESEEVNENKEIRETVPKSAPPPQATDGSNNGKAEEMDVAGNNDGGKAQMAVTEEAKTPENAQGSEAVLAEDAKIVAENGAIEESEEGNENKEIRETVPKSAPQPQATDGSNNGKAEESVKAKGASPTGAMDPESSLPNEENEFISGLKENEKKALAELRSTVEHAILNNKIFEEEKKEESNKENTNSTAETEEPKKVLEDSPKQAKEEQNGGNIEDKSETSEVIKTAEESKEISLWGVPLLPSKGDHGTDGLLLKFLGATDFKANDAFQMLRNTLEWRRKNNMDSIMEEDFGNEYNSMSYMKGLGREGHPVCYNVFGVFADDEMYQRTFGTEAGRNKFLRWRLQLLEKEIRKLDFRPGGISTMIQVNDLKNIPGVSRKDVRLASRQAMEILQDNYPEFVAKYIFINVPLWYYAFNALLSPFLTQRTKSKFMFCRPASVTETLLQCIAGELIPTNYGGLQRDNDPDFSTQDAATEVLIKAGATETVEIPMPEVGKTMIWDLNICGWDVNYKEEFVPTNEESYTLIVKKQRKITWQDEPIRNSFKNNEPGKLVITIENGMFKRKRMLYRSKIKGAASSCSSSSG